MTSNKTLRILVVEDNPADADLIREYLPTTGPTSFQIEAVTRLSEAMIRLDRAGFDLVLLDLGLPDSQGLQTLRELHQAAPDVPVVVLTGTDDHELGVTAMQYGAEDYLVKSQVNQHLLERTIWHALERHKAAQVLQKSERRFHTLAAISPAGIFQTDAQGQTTYVNPRWCELSGLSAAEALGDGWLRAVHPDDREKLHQDWQATTKQQSTSKTDYRFLHPDGTILWVMGQAVPETNAAGHIVGYVGTITDITERKRAEELLLVRLRLIQFAENHPLAELLQKTLDEVGVIVASPVAFFHFVEADQKTLTLQAWSTQTLEKFCHAAGQGQHYHLDQAGVWADCIRERRAVIHNDYAALPNQKGLPPGHATVVRELVVPIFRQDKVVAVLGVGNKPQDYTEKDLETVTFLADVAWEIAARKRAAQALREAAVFSQATIDALSSHLCVVDENGVIMATNKAWNDFAANNPPTVQRASPGINYLTVCDQATGPAAEEAAQFAAGLRAVIRGERDSFSLEYPCHSPQEKRWFIGRVTRFGETTPTRVVVTHENITERKLTGESHARLATAVEQAAETIVITDTQGTILYANPAFEKTSGYTCAEALGQNPRVLRSGQHEAEFYHQMWDVLVRGEVWHGHFINKRKDGKLYEEEATISPIRNREGQIVNYVAVKRDVTREVQLETQFRQSQKMQAIGQLAGGVAHDFNNILSVIQMQAYLLKLDSSLTSEQLASANEIDESVRRAAALTRQLLLFSRREVFQPTDLELNEAIATTTKMLKRMLGETIEMQLNLAAQPLLVHADVGMLDQVLMNLAVNARDAMPNGGRLVIETAGVELDELAVTQCIQARPGSFVRLTVSDNGCGIAPEVLPQIFEPFFTTKDVGKGTGLGLATVFGIVQQHQGWINVVSEVGHGTTFHLYLPRQQQPAVVKSATPTSATLRGGSETILLVEDEPALRFAVRKALTQLGYQILEAPTGHQALKVWQEHRDEIRLLLTDLVMPDGMSGIALAEKLRQMQPNLKVIYMSGYSSEVAGHNFPLQEGVNFLPKPFQAKKLADAIRNYLDKPA